MFFSLMQAMAETGGDIRTTDAMGEYSEVMVRVTMKLISIENPVNFGVVTEEQLE